MTLFATLKIEEASGLRLVIEMLKISLFCMTIGASVGIEKVVSLIL
jgi:hypothetical protein